MKRILSVFLTAALLLSFAPHCFAQDGFEVSHTVVKSNDDIRTIDVVLPRFGGFNGADRINKEVLNIALDAIGDANAVAESMLPLKKELEEKDEPAASMVVSLDMTYDYVKLNDILSVQLNIYSYYGGAHGMSQVLSITSNTFTGEIYEFKDLFKEGVDYNRRVTELILAQIEEDPEMYFSDYEETITNKDGDYEFYIDGNKIIVYFGLYDIAPYAAGIRYFPIASGDIKDILKDEVYNSIKSGDERSAISYNGKDIKSDKDIINSDDIMLIPLRVIAEALGYEVGWNNRDGAIVAEEPVSITPQRVIDGTTYVPVSFFKDVLNENVSLGIIAKDKIIVRVYGEDNAAETNNLGLIKEYKNPETAHDAVKMYAEAIKTRNGVVQYALFDDDLREEKYGEFKGLNFITGTSSPWIDSYEISELEGNVYQIKFTEKTSVPTDIYTFDINVKLIEEGQPIKITSVE